jgi:death-on-curing protein
VSFDGVDLYPDLVAKAAALCFSLTCDHPFVDGNKRTAHAAAETMLLLNGFELRALVDEQESVMLSLASGALSRDDLTEWIRLRLVQVNDGA